MEWFDDFVLTKAPDSLSGDKIILPPSALEQLLSKAPSIKSNDVSPSSESFYAYNTYSIAAQRHARAQLEAQQRKLPNPLTFKLFNPETGRTVYAGIKEFSAKEGCIALSPFLLTALNASSSVISVNYGTKFEATTDDGTEEPLLHRQGTKLSVHFEELPKGTFIKLRPLEAGYDPDDWKALLESYLRSNFTTLTKGETLDVRASGNESFQFLVDEFRPASTGICVVDTDLEVDIEALSEDQARETLKRIAEKRRLAPVTTRESSRGGELKFMRIEQGQVASGEYVDYELKSWPRAEPIEIALDVEEDGPRGQVDLLASPFDTRLRAKPREDEHVFADFQDLRSKRLRLTSSAADFSDADSLLVSVHAASFDYASADQSSPLRFTLKASIMGTGSHAVSSSGSGSVISPDEVICEHCQHAIPKQSIVLHENFCRRNNVRCPYSKTCNQVFQRNSSSLKEHWHCDIDSCASSGSSQSTYEHHLRIYHTAIQCPSCSYPDAFPSLPVLAEHRITRCPNKQILCTFCHLVVPQEGNGADPFATPDAEVLLSGLTAHEVADGARTTECHMCNRLVRLRDMETHLKNHDFERFSRPVPRVCRNIMCGRTLDGANTSGDTRSASKMGQGPGNDVGLCSICFAPLYVSMHDPEGKALKRRVERRYLSQLTSGCGKQSCRNPMCKNGRIVIASETPQNLSEGGRILSISEATPLIRPYVDALKESGENSTPLHFCTDEMNQRRRSLADMLTTEGKDVLGEKQYSFPWCIAALEAHKGDASKAHEWLKNFAPSAEDEMQRTK